MITIDNPEVISRMDEWADRIAEKIFEKETIGIPQTVCALAAIRFLAKCVKNSSVLTEAAVLKLVEGELEKDKDYGRNIYVS